MQYPYQANRDNTALNELHIRFDNALGDDVIIGAGGTIIYVLDAHFLYTLFMERDHDIAYQCASIIYKAPLARFAIFPETLFELRKGMEVILKRITSNCNWQQLVNFAKSEQIRTFRKLMTSHTRNWELIVNHIFQMVNDHQTKKLTLAVFELCNLLDFEQPLKSMRQSITQKRVLKLKALCDLLMIPSISYDEGARRLAFSVLNSQRNRFQSDLIDATVYSKVVNINQELKKRRINHIACRFLSHESMIDMLEGFTPEASRRYTRSYTDSSLLYSFLRGDKRNVALVNLIATLLHDLSSTTSITAEREIHLGQVIAKIDALRKDLFKSSHDYTYNYATAGIEEIIQRRAERFVEGLNKIEMNKESLAQFASRYSYQIEIFYKTICRMKHGSNDLDHFMARVRNEHLKLWKLSANEDDVVNIILNILTELRDNEDPEIYITDIFQYNINLEMLITRIRNEVLPNPAMPPSRIAKVAYFIARLESMVSARNKNKKESINRAIKTAVALILHDPILGTKEITRIGHEVGDHETLRLAIDLIDKLDPKDKTEADHKQQALVILSTAQWSLQEEEEEEEDNQKSLVITDE